MSGRISWLGRAICAAVVCVSAVSAASADVFNMPSGLTSLDTVPVGDPGNAADTTGYGAVDYAYRIGTYEVTAGQYAEFLNAVAGVDTYDLYNTMMWTYSYGCRIERFAGSGISSDPYQYRIASDWANRPVNFVSWGDAARFANWLHNGQPSGAQEPGTTETGAYSLNGAMTIDELMAVTREADWKWAITSEDEWYKAAYYNPATATYYEYPTSSDSAPSNDLIDPDPGNNATYKDLSHTIGSPYYRTEVRAHENSFSPYGTFDQGGNISEWNEAAICDEYLSYRGLRGGNFLGGVEGLEASYRYQIDPIAQQLWIGFRVSEVPEPSSMALLALGAVGMLRSRRNVRG